MFSGKTSRSHSFSSMKSGGEFEHQAPDVEQTDYKEGYDIPPSEKWHTSTDYKFTAGHPIGKALLKLAQDVTTLAKKNNSKAIETNLDELCSDFYNGIRLERAKVNNKYDNTVPDVERALMKKELNSHCINAAVEPPDNFSVIPVITSTQKLSEVQKIFPRASKFSGHTKDGHVTVIEFLTALNTAQNQCDLSESEFIDSILASCTGTAYDLVHKYKINGDSASTIYHSLLQNFDNRMTADEARQKLITFAIGKNSNLAKAESALQLLVARASSIFPPGEFRNSYRNMEACLILIRALPPYSSLKANDLYQNFTTRLGRACTMDELFRGLDQYRSSIDRDIKANGADTYNYKTSINKHKKYTSYMMDAGLNNTSGQLVRPTPPPQFKARGSYNNDYSNYNAKSYTPKPMNRNFGRAGFQNNRNSQNKYPQRNRGPRNNRNNAQNNYKNCALCGKGHKVPDCMNIRDDTGKKLEMHPTYGVCNKCPSFVKPRLHHPEFVCPYRPGGPLNTKIKN